jgi:ethanolamine transporter EutH
MALGLTWSSNELALGYCPLPTLFPRAIISAAKGAWFSRNENILHEGLISWMLAVPLAFILARLLARQLGQTMIEVDLDFAFNWMAVLFWLLIIVVIAVMASFLPARKASRISLRESLAYAEMVASDSSYHSIRLF